MRFLLKAISRIGVKEARKATESRDPRRHKNAIHPRKGKDLFLLVLLGWLLRLTVAVCVLLL